MPHEILASVRVELAEDPQQMAEALGEVAEAWASMLAAIDQRKPDVSFSVNETRNKPGRPRKPKLVTPPEAA